MNFSFESIGTRWQIVFFEKITKQKANLLKEEIWSFLNDFDLSYSRFNQKSLVYQISKKGGSYTFPESSRKIFSLYKKLYEITNGKFTPLIGETLDSMGYDSNYSFIVREVKKPKLWNDAITFKYPHLTVKSPVVLDFGGCGKGYAVDQISKTLQKETASFLIDAGGDIYSHNYKATIGLEHPHNSNQVIGTVGINNESVCGSSLNRRKWLNFSHIVDPEGLSSPTNILSTWVISKETVIADSIATALFLCEPKKLKENFDFEYLILYSDLTIEKSSNFNCQIYYN